MTSHVASCISCCKPDIPICPEACEHPTAVEIVDCCNMALKLQAELEVRLHCLQPRVYFLVYATKSQMRIFTYGS